MSIYLTTNDVEEVAALAAIQLTRADYLTKAVWAVRIRQEELVASGIRVATKSGTTGVPKIDKLHRNLYAPAGFATLTRLLLRAQETGEDRVRQVKRPVLAYQIGNFRQLPNGEISEKRRTKCERILTALSS